MYDINLNSLAAMGVPGAVSQTGDRHGRLWKTASRLYTKALAHGRAARFCAWLTGRTNTLYDLNRLGVPAASQHYGGVQTVPVKLIQGSEGRCHDFDRDFHPLSPSGRERWLGVALAVLDGQSMSPVCLIRVGDIYFVRDGHHRVSIARAWGQDFIDAEVMVWEAQHPLPWEQAAPARRPLQAPRNVLSGQA